MNLSLWSLPIWLAITTISVNCGCHRELPDRVESPRPVVVVKLNRFDPAARLRLTGTVEPWAEEDVAFEVAGRMTYIVEPSTFLQGRWVEDGEEEIEGDVLATLDSEPYVVALAAIESQVEVARVNYESVLPAKLLEAKAQNLRAEKQYDRNLRIRTQTAGAISEQQIVDSQAERDATRAALQQAEAAVDAGKAELKSAEAARSAAELNLANTTLYAPFRGEVTDVLVQAGGYVEGGKPVAHLVTMDPIKARVSVSAETNRLINRGEPVRVFVPERKEEVVGNVYQKTTVANPATRTFGLTLICRNHKVWNSEAEAEIAQSMPRVIDLLPATRLDITGGGPLYVEERKTLRQDDEGYFVWIAEGVNLQDPSREPHGVLTIRKVRVVPGEQRVNYQGIFLARELADPGALEFGQACVVGVPDDAQDGDQVALLPESWLLQPGSLIDVQFVRDAGVVGFYVPVQAIVPSGSANGHVFVAKRQGSEGDPEATTLAHKVDVALHETVGQLQRIEAEQADAIDVGVQVIVRGANYLTDGEPVSVVRTDEVVP
ncbi:MAG: efflux RND transporter periplasmic adaptor subunit [Bythopirellula sp.]